MKEKILKGIGSLLNEFVPDDIAEKGLSKLDPRVKKFFSSSIKNGLGAGAALSFLRSNLGNNSADTQNLQRRTNPNLVEQRNQFALRPDEMASLNRRKDDAKRDQVAKQLLGIGVPLTGSAIAAGEIMGQQGETQQPQPPLSPQQEALKRYYTARGQRADQQAQQPGMGGQGGSERDQILAGFEKLAQTLQNLKGR